MIDSVEVQQISEDRVLVIIKNGEIVQGQAELSLDHARGLYFMLGITIDQIQKRIFPK